MTDEQIIKALELCFADDFEKCEECPLKDKRDIIFSCIRTKQELTRDLIKRQKAEIEELRADYNYLFETMPHMIAEAIKKFAERLGEELKNCRAYDGGIRQRIDNLVKEMAESVAGISKQNGGM